MQTPQRAPGDGRGRPGAGGIRRAGLVWFRGDLRLHDHEALAKANSECSSLLPVYCFDPRDYEKVCCLCLTCSQGTVCMWVGVWLGGWGRRVMDLTRCVQELR